MCLIYTPVEPRYLKQKTHCTFIASGNNCLFLNKYKIEQKDLRRHKYKTYVKTDSVYRKNCALNIS